MSETEETQETRSSRASVVYRHATLVEGAELQVHQDRSVFVVMDEPPPVRTVVQLWRGGEARAVVVERSVEVPETDEGARGFFAVPADEEAIARGIKVGTEHLERGSRPDSEGSGGEAGSDAEGNMNMAMPAPVVVHDDGDEDEPTEASGASESSNDEGSGADADAADGEGESSASSDDSNGGDAQPRQRRRRGKRRR